MDPFMEPVSFVESETPTVKSDKTPDIELPPDTPPEIAEMIKKLDELGKLSHTSPTAIEVNPSSGEVRMVNEDGVQPVPPEVISAMHNLVKELKDKLQNDPMSQLAAELGEHLNGQDPTSINYLTVLGWDENAVSAFSKIVTHGIVSELHKMFSHEAAMQLYVDTDFCEQTAELSMKFMALGIYSHLKFHVRRDAWHLTTLPGAADAAGE